MSSTSSATPYFQTMSPVPPEPTPSQAPPSLATATQEPEPTSTTPSSFPKVKLRLELRDLSHKSTDLFLKNSYPSDAIFNVDETGFALGTTLPSKVLIKRGDTIAFKKISGRQE